MKKTIGSYRDTRRVQSLAASFNLLSQDHVTKRLMRLQILFRFGASTLRRELLFYSQRKINFLEIR